MLGCGAGREARKGRYYFPGTQALLAPAKQLYKEKLGEISPQVNLEAYKAGLHRPLCIRVYNHNYKEVILLQNDSQNFRNENLSSEFETKAPFLQLGYQPTGPEGHTDFHQKRDYYLPTEERRKRKGETEIRLTAWQKYRNHFCSTM